MSVDYIMTLRRFQRVFISKDCYKSENYCIYFYTEEKVKYCSLKNNYLIMMNNKYHKSFLRHSICSLSLKFLQIIVVCLVLFHLFVHLCSIVHHCLLTLSLSSTGGYASALFVFYDDKKTNHSMSHASQFHANTMTPLDNAEINDNQNESVRIKTFNQTTK